VQDTHTDTERIAMNVDAVNPFAKLIDTAAGDWIPLIPGNYMKVLRVSDENGYFTLLIRADAGAVNGRHRHIGPADFYVLSGCIEYRGGVATEGCYIYEPAGVIHPATTHPVDTIYLSHVYGPIAFLDDDDNVVNILDFTVIKSLVAAHESRKVSA
jgi:anti-sigma factor ChrR (cupin superfamily)